VKRLLALALGCVPGEEPAEEKNLPPVARFLWPQLWAASEPAPFDATESYDPDGELVRLSVAFGDGTLEQDRPAGLFEHLYTAPGSYDVRLEVEDDDGELAEVVGTVVVVARLADPPCSCELPCFDDAVCTAAGCFLAGLSDDDEEPPELPGALVCE
jgi:hypothetical protein